MSNHNIDNIKFKFQPIYPVTTFFYRGKWVPVKRISVGLRDVRIINDSLKDSFNDYSHTLSFWSFSPSYLRPIIVDDIFRYNSVHSKVDANLNSFSFVMAKDIFLCLANSKTYNHPLFVSPLLKSFSSFFILRLLFDFKLRNSIKSSLGDLVEGMEAIKMDIPRCARIDKKAPPTPEEFNYQYFVDGFNKALLSYYRTHTSPSKDEDSLASFTVSYKERKTVLYGAFASFISLFGFNMGLAETKDSELLAYYNFDGAYRSYDLNALQGMAFFTNYTLAQPHFEVEGGLSIWPRSFLSKKNTQATIWGVPFYDLFVYFYLYKDKPFMAPFLHYFYNIQKGADLSFMDFQFINSFKKKDKEHLIFFLEGIVSLFFERTSFNIFSASLIKEFLIEELGKSKTFNGLNIFLKPTKKQSYSIFFPSFEKVVTLFKNSIGEFLNINLVDLFKDSFIKKISKKILPEELESSIPLTHLVAMERASFNKFSQFYFSFANFLVKDLDTCLLFTLFKGEILRFFKKGSGETLNTYFFSRVLFDVQFLDANKLNNIFSKLYNLHNSCRDVNIEGLSIFTNFIVTDLSNKSVSFVINFHGMISYHEQLFKDFVNDLRNQPAMPFVVKSINSSDILPFLHVFEKKKLFERKEAFYLLLLDFIWAIPHDNSLYLEEEVTFRINYFKILVEVLEKYGFNNEPIFSNVFFFDSYLGSSSVVENLKKLRDILIKK